MSENSINEKKIGEAAQENASSQSPKKKLQHWQLFYLFILIISTVAILLQNKSESTYRSNDGRIFGTFYNISYQGDEDLKAEVEAELLKVDGSLSPFNDTSIISRINRNEEVLPDSLFMRVFNLAQVITQATDGAFDITVAPLVNAWGFGFKNSSNVDSLTVDSLLQFIGSGKVWAKEGRIEKARPEVMLDCSSIAKGFGSDVVAALFDRKGIENYMVEIGGEIVMKGVNKKGEPWKIGVNKPVDDSLAVNQELQTILSISNKGMATSGNYRNFYYKDGKKYAHTIDPRTGYPVQHSLLSATVIADDCATADAYATAFMVLGVERALEICEKDPNLEGYFIYTNKKGETETCFTSGMKAYITGTERTTAKSAQ